jgi:arylsulfatase
MGGDRSCSVVRSTAVLMAVTTLVGGLVIAGCRRAPASPANAILITIDTLRADHLGIHGYVRDTSPNLDALARAGTWFERCYAQSVTTRASHATIFTATYPSTHGVLSNGEKYPDRPSLMTALKAAGYTTAGFVSSVVVARTWGAQAQLDHFDDAATTTEVNRPNMAERPARDTLQAVLAYLERRDGSKPFFVWIHLIDPHGPYTAPIEPDRFVGDAHAKPGQRKIPLGETNLGFRNIPRYQILNGNQDPDYYVARYDAEIRYADDALGEFVARLRELDLFEPTLMVVTSDHGETLAEPTHRRFFSHGLTVYEEVSRIPLIVHEPFGGRRLRALDTTLPALALDIAPTMLDLLGVASPPEFEGRSMLAGARAADTVAFSLGSYGSRLIEQEMGSQFGAREGPWRYIRNSVDGYEELYDHRSDPGETRNLAEAYPDELERARQQMDELLARPTSRNEQSPIDQPERERLRALGYVR